MPTIVTIAAERQALADLFTNLTFLKAIFPYEPKNLGVTPALSIMFIGFQAVVPGTLRLAKQLREYEVRLYVELADQIIAQQNYDNYFQQVWETLVRLQRLHDDSNVIIASLGDASTKWITDAQNKAYIEGTIQLTIEHRVTYI